MIKNVDVSIKLFKIKFNIYPKNPINKDTITFMRDHVKYVFVGIKKGVVFVYNIGVKIEGRL